MVTRSLHVNRDIILATKRQTLKERQKQMPTGAILALAQMRERPRYLLATVEDRGRVALIGQVTRTQMYDPVSTALRFIKEGADSISFFTDHAIYDTDHDDMLLVARGLQKTPIIYQNYVLDEYGVMAARASDASAIMIYASLLNETMLRRVVSMTQRWKMTALVQASTPEQLYAAIRLSPHTVCYGDNLSENIERPLAELQDLRDTVPHHVKIMLSQAIQTFDDAEAVIRSGVDAII
ncbi:MAG: hypothetical protein ACPG7F_19070, partial [Aggregatilineales bacterium]